MPLKNILIADDEVLIREMLVISLKDKDYRFFQASNGKEAVEIAEQNPIDLAILDIIMPHMDGVEALKRIKRIDRTIEVLMITGYADLGSLREIIFDHGALDYLLKPFNIVELTLSVQRSLRHRELVLKSSFVKEELENRILELERDFKEKTFSLRESQIKYRNIVENSTDAIVVTQDGYLKFANTKAMELTGYSMAEVLNLPFIEIVHPDDRVEAMERYRNRLKGNDVPPTSTFRVVRKDGSSFWVENRAAMTFWEEKPATLNILRDISQRLAGHEALRIKDFAIASSINGVAFADLKGNFTYVNDSFLRIWGYDHEEEVLGKEIDIFLQNPADIFDLLQSLHHKRRWFGEKTVTRKDGSPLDIQMTVNIITDRADRPVSLMITFADITGQKKMEDAIMRSEKLSSLGQLSAGLAHELRNPLAVISSCSQFCLDNMSLERLVRENFQVIYRNSQRASKLISELLAFARPDQLEQNEVDINEVLVSVLHMTKLEVDPSHVTFVQHLKKGLPKIMGDKEKLGQVFLNLMQNAIHAVSGRGKIILETRLIDTDDMVEVRVIDNGPGIPEDYSERVFDPFFTTKDGGTGLGLSVCNSIVEQHQGDINIECGKEVGTKVSVRLPVKQEER